MLRPLPRRPDVFLLVFALLVGVLPAQTPAALRLAPNLKENIERPLRYRPEGAEFVIENGPEFFNRSLYGGNTAFRVDAGDRPEFVLYLPGRGGNLRLGLQSAGAAKWLHECARVVMRYRPGELIYEISDSLLGPDASLRVTAVAYRETEGLAVRIEGQRVGSGVELLWAFGGVNGQRGARDGDIGTEKVPISEYFQLRPEFCRDNTISLSTEGFSVRAKAGVIAGVVPAGSRQWSADARQWNAGPSGLRDLGASSADVPAVVAGAVALENSAPLFLSLQRLERDPTASVDLATYREVSTPGSSSEKAGNDGALAAVYSRASLPTRFASAETQTAAVRERVTIDTPDPYLNAAMGALNIAADALWDEPQRAIMHGSIAWRTKLLGWRGPYVLDALGWHDRARANALYWAGRQNTSPIPATLPPADEKANLARNETGLHSNGDLSNSHYDMNLVYIDAVFRHLLWTGDEAMAKELWPVIERHLAWERRLFRREFGPEKLPLYEAYAAIWASDDLQYSGGGTAHASAYNYFHNRMAARIASLVGADPAPFTREAELIARGMREFLWQKDRGGFAESKDLLGRQAVHPSIGLWTFYHTIDSGVPTPQEAWDMTGQIDRELPHLPVSGPGVPAGLYTLGTSNWMPYDWSINNVVMGEAVHTALAYWQAGRPEDAWRISKGSLLAAMYMGISPGNVGTMSLFDVYRRESQRDFGDGAGVLSRTLVEGLFGVRPDALAGVLELAPGFPADWAHAQLRHPDVEWDFRRSDNREQYRIAPKFPRAMQLRFRLRALGRDVVALRVNGKTASWKTETNPGGESTIVFEAPAATATEIAVDWSGSLKMNEARAATPLALTSAFEPLPALDAKDRAEPVDLSALFNDRVTQIFRNEYRSPRSPYVSLALPKQGLGGWAGGVNATAEIDDSGLRRQAASQGGRIVLPSGVPFATPGGTDDHNVLFVSQWSNYRSEASVPLQGRAARVFLLMAGSTNAMQSRIDNGEVIATYQDGTTERLALENPTTWWPIDQDYFIDDFQFRRPGALPMRVDLKTGAIRVLDPATFAGQGRKIAGGAATVLSMRLNPGKDLRSLTVRALANDVVIGLMSATLVRAAQ